MDIQILDENFIFVKNLDAYISLIWAERLFEYGDFELYLLMDNEILEYVKLNRYIRIPYSNRLMIIEEIKITTDYESGNKLIIKGKSLESLLNRRIVYSQTRVSSKIQTAVKKLLNENVISPSDQNRKFPNFVFKDTNDQKIDSLKITAQYTGDNLYDVISSICKNVRIGFSIILNDDNKFEFELYSGKDRSYDQIKNPYVVFSKEYNNLLSSNFKESVSKLKNFALVGGTGEGKDRKTAVVGEEISGFERRELYVDARDLLDMDENGDPIDDKTYKDQLIERGKTKLSSYKKESRFDGENEVNGQFKYNEDYYIGDLVQIIDEYGNSKVVLITETVISEDSSGLRIYPTFTSLEDLEEEE